MRKIILACVLALVLSNFSDASGPKGRELEFDYQAVIEDIPQGAANLKIWLPILPQTEYQIIEDLKIDPQDSSVITFDKVYNNKILNYTIKSPHESTMKINVHYKVKRYEYSNDPKHPLLHNGRHHPQEDLSLYLKPNRLVTLSPKVKKLARDVIKGKKTTIDRARAIYDYVFQNVSYDKTIAGWGQGDTERVCFVKAGNCTDFHSLFISLARVSGIPAKFVIGVPISDTTKEGEIKGYHCWAEFYDKQLGWIPVDVSEAWKDKSKYEYYFGNLGENRLEFTQGRDIILEPNQNGEPLNYFVYPYVEINGKEYKKVQVLFKFKDREEKGKDQLTPTI